MSSGRRSSLRSMRLDRRSSASNTSLLSGSARLQCARDWRSWIEAMKRYSRRFRRLPDDFKAAKKSRIAKLLMLLNRCERALNRVRLDAGQKETRRKIQLRGGGGADGDIGFLLGKVSQIEALWKAIMFGSRAPFPEKEHSGRCAPSHKLNVLCCLFRDATPKAEQNSS